MKLAWRGVVDRDGDVVAWPTLLADHNEAFVVLPHLREYRARWRQWDVDSPAEFDAGATDADRRKVLEWLQNH